MKNKLHRFESFKPRQLEDRQDSPAYKKLEAEKQLRKAKVEEIIKQTDFKSGKPVLALELADRIGGRVERDGDLTWKIECDEFGPYAEFAIWFSLEPTEEVPGFQIIDMEGDYIYQGLDTEKAHVAMDN